MKEYRKIRITEEIWTGKEWKKFKETIKREPILSFADRIIDFKTCGSGRS